MDGGEPQMEGKSRSIDQTSSIQLPLSPKCDVSMEVSLAQTCVPGVFI